MDIDALLKDRSKWELVRQLIKSGQVPEDRMAEIARDHPEFWSTLHK